MVVRVDPQCFRVAAFCGEPDHLLDVLTLPSVAHELDFLPGPFIRPAVAERELLALGFEFGNSGLVTLGQVLNDAREAHESVI